MLMRLVSEYYFGFDHPKEDGHYACLTRWGRLDNINFTVEYGWNTSADNTEHAFEDEDIWVWFPELEDELSEHIPNVYECEDCGHHFTEFDEKLETYVDNHGGEDVVWSEKVKCCPKCRSTEWKEWGV